MVGMTMNIGASRRQRTPGAGGGAGVAGAEAIGTAVFMHIVLVDNINILTGLVDFINYSRMNQRATTPHAATLESLMSLFASVKKALRHEMQDGAEPTVAPMLLRMLQLCERHPGITQQGLAQQTARDKGQVARLVKELLDLGLLIKEEHPNDRRSHRLLPTSAGVAAVRRFEQAEAGVGELMFGGLRATELRALNEQLGAWKQRIEAQLPPDDAG
jgi:DNA-binding MarR family transcriptional regulator